MLLALCSLLFDHCSLLFAHCSLLTALYSLLLAHCSLLIAPCSLLFAHCSLFFGHCPLRLAPCSLLICSLLFAQCYLLFFVELSWQPNTVSRRRKIRSVCTCKDYICTKLNFQQSHIRSSSMKEICLRKSAVIAEKYLRGRST